MKKLVELQLATKPRGSSISASSAPAWMAWISAWIRFRRLCELSLRSNTSGPLVRKVEVKSERPRVFDSGLGVFHSATMTTVALPITKRGSWFGVRLTPRVTISRMCAPSGHAVLRQRVEDGLRQLGARHADVERDRGRAFVQAVEVRVEADQAALHQAQPFPDAVAEDEAAVEDRDARLVARHELAVDVDQHAVVARVGEVALGAFALGEGSWRVGHGGLAVGILAVRMTGVRSRTRDAAR